MVEMVFGLMLYLNGNLIEHTYKKSLSDCLKSKRVAIKEVNPESVVFKCIKSKANVEIYMGEKKITSLILD